jgi:hypothetical protein
MVTMVTTFWVLLSVKHAFISKKAFLYPRHNVFTAEAEAEEIPEHRTYNVAHPDASALIDDISTEVGVTINRRVMKEAMQWHVNIATVRLLLKHFI